MKNAPRRQGVEPPPPHSAGLNGFHLHGPGLNGHATGWNRYLVGDARKLSRFLAPTPSVDVTVTSPPYWDIKNYETKNQIGYRQTLDEYLDDLVRVFSAVWEGTKPSGSLWVVMKSIKKDGRLYQLPFLLSERLTGSPTHPWRLQDVLVWHKPHTLPWSHRQKLTDNYEHILCFSKTDQFDLRIDAIRSTAGITNYWVKYPERYHPVGKAISNVWEIAIPTQGSWGNGQFEHSCPLPLELVKRAILLSTDSTGTVLDPFAGTGSVPLAAHKLGRRWLALDANRKYRDMFRRRLASEEAKGQPPADAPEVDLHATNLSLRQLKFAKLLYRLVAPSLRLTATDIPLIAVVGGARQRAAKPHWVTGVRVWLVLADGGRDSRATEIGAEVDRQMGKAPLSKFQVEVSVSVLSYSDFLKSQPFTPNKRLHVYERGEFWTSKKVVKLTGLASLEPVAKWPPIVSDLQVDEHPAY